MEALTMKRTCPHCKQAAVEIDHCQLPTLCSYCFETVDADISLITGILTLFVLAISAAYQLQLHSLAMLLTLLFVTFTGITFRFAAHFMPLVQRPG
jgi:hypothetical protein